MIRTGIAVRANTKMLAGKKVFVALAMIAQSYDYAGVVAGAGALAAAGGANAPPGATGFPPTVSIEPGGGIVLRSQAALQSAFNGAYVLGSTATGWQSVSVDRSVEQHGVVTVHASTTTFRLERRYVANNSRVLINDTFTCFGHRRCPLFTNHTATFVAPTEVRLNGGFNAPQLGECTTNLVRGTNGNPSVVAVSKTGGGLGIMPLDDVFRVHASMTNRASPTRIPHASPCAVSSSPALDVIDAYLALGNGQTYTAEWALYLIEPAVSPARVPWVFANRLRADLGVNAIVLQGGATLASWETEILAAGNWSAPGCHLNGSEPGALHTQDTVCFPTYDDELLSEFLRYQGTGLVVSNIMRMEHGWPRCPDNATRDYCYGSCSTARQESRWSDVYMHRLVSSLKRVGFKGKALLYLHPFISTELGAPEKYADDRQLQADGLQVCDYQGEYVGTMHNKYGQQLLKFISLAMDTFGFQGIYLDESSYGVTPLDFSPLHSDNHSAIIDPKTFQITQHVSFVPLVWQELQTAIYDEVVSKRGGTMIANSQPVTRTVMQAGIRNNVVQFIESAAKGRESWGWTYTPVGLSKALFQLSDPDPSYANVTGLPVDNLWADLDFGTLTYMYDMLLPNVTGWRTKRNVMQHIFPTTPIEIGPGFIHGVERIVTKVPNSFTFKPPMAAAATRYGGSTRLQLTVRYFDRSGWHSATESVEGPVVFAKVDGGGDRSFAVIEPTGQ